MKNFILIFLVFTCSIEARAQFIHRIKADSVLISNDSCNAELIIKNSTKDSLGYLYNKGNGRTEFRKILHKANDSGLYLIGGDSLSFGATQGISDSSGRFQLGRSSFGNFATPIFAGSRYLETNTGRIVIQKGILTPAGTVYQAPATGFEVNVEDTLAPGVNYASYGSAYATRRISGLNATLWGRYQSQTNNALSVRHYFAEDNKGFVLSGRTADTTYIPTVANLDAMVQFGHKTLRGNYLNGEISNIFSHFEMFNYNASSNGSYLKAFFDFDAGGTEGVFATNFEVGERVGLNVRPIKNSIVDSAYAIRTRGTADSVVLAGPARIGGQVKLSNIPSGLLTDSLLTIDPATNLVRKVSSSLLGSGIPDTIGMSTKAWTQMRIDSLAAVTQPRDTAALPFDDEDYIVSISNINMAILPNLTYSGSGSSHNVVMPAAPSGKIMYFFNQNTHATNKWIFSGVDVEDTGGNTVTTLDNLKTYTLYFAADKWRVINIF